MTRERLRVVVSINSVSWRAGGGRRGEGEGLGVRGQVPGECRRPAPLHAPASYCPTQYISSTYVNYTLVAQVLNQSSDINCYREVVG